MQIPWPEVTGLEIQRGSEVENQAAAGRRRTGVLSRMGEKKAGAIFAATTTDGNTVSFRTASMTFSELSGTLAPLLEAIDTARRETQPVPTGSPDSAAVPDSLSELSDLHERGALTDEEFAAAK